MTRGLERLEGGARIHVLERGSGRPILFVHGWPANGTVWRRQLDGLSDQFHVIAPDLPGYGNSPPMPRPTLARMARVVRELIEARGLDGVFLIGWSMGAGIAMSYARDFGSHRLAAIGIVDDCPKLLPGEGWELGIDTTFDPAGLDGWRRRWATDRRSVIVELTEMEFTEPTRWPSEVAELADQSMKAHPEAALTSLLDAFDQDFRGAVSEIDVPTLLMYGGRSRLTTPANRQFMARTIPRADLVTFEGSGHNPMIEEADLFNETVRAFASRLGTWGPADRPRR